MALFRRHRPDSLPPLLLDERIAFRRTRARIDAVVAFGWTAAELARSLHDVGSARDSSRRSRR